MKIRVMSDLHNEFQQLVVPALPDDKETILVLAGDIDLFKTAGKPRLFNFIKKCSKQFAHVICVAGNHEYYGATLEIDAAQFEKRVTALGNVHFLNDRDVVIENVAFVGTTLWTDFDNQNAQTLMFALGSMNDYRMIWYEDIDGNSRRLLPSDIVFAHDDSVEFIFRAIAKHKAENRKVVVVTHHGPSFQSTPEMYRDSKYNGCYYSDLDQKIIDTQPDIWVHGHTHSSACYMIGNTKVVCNPRGYITHNPSDRNLNFDPKLTIEI